jgi:hypothetical protein
MNGKRERLKRDWMGIIITLTDIMTGLTKPIYGETVEERETEMERETEKAIKRETVRVKTKMKRMTETTSY